ncbi:MAG TPA: DUF4342 domain-containing protein [bacterium]|nr:DUF4342 domain-containing protein [bacterium]
MTSKKNYEKFTVSGEKILEKIKEIIKNGNARKIIIKNQKEDILLDIPLTFGAIGIIIAPILAAVGTITALVTKCTIIIEKK